MGVAKDGNLRQVIDECVQVAKTTLEPESGLANAASEPSSFDPLGLTWCTWFVPPDLGCVFTPKIDPIITCRNALGPEYSLSKVLECLEGFGLSRPSSSPELRSTPKSLFASSIDAVLLDDGWQDARAFPDPFEPDRARRGVWSFGAKSGWVDVFEPNGTGEVEGEGLLKMCKRQDSGFHSSSPGNESDEEEASRESLEDAVKKIKSFGIANVGVWMTLGAMVPLPSFLFAQTY